MLFSNLYSPGVSRSENESSSAVSVTPLNTGAHLACPGCWQVAPGSLSTMCGCFPELHTQLETKISPNKRCLSPLGFLVPHCRNTFGCLCSKEICEEKGHSGGYRISARDSIAGFRVIWLGKMPQIPPPNGYHRLYTTPLCCSLQPRAADLGTGHSDGCHRWPRAT